MQLSPRQIRNDLPVFSSSPKYPASESVSVIPLLKNSKTVLTWPSGRVVGHLGTRTDFLPGRSRSRPSSSSQELQTRDCFRSAWATGSSGVRSRTETSWSLLILSLLRLKCVATLAPRHPDRYFNIGVALNVTGWCSDGKTMGSGGGCVWRTWNGLCQIFCFVRLKAVFCGLRRMQMKRRTETSKKNTIRDWYAVFFIKC